MLVIVLACSTQTAGNQMGKKVKEFKIEIIRYYFGRENVRIVVTHEQLMCESSLVLNQKDYTLVKRILTQEESSGLKEILSVFPLGEFKENYYNKGVKDGMQLRFIIKIDNVEKNISVANYYIKELGNLVSEIMKLFPEDHINYSRESVSTVIEK